MGTSNGFLARIHVVYHSETRFPYGGFIFDTPGGSHVELSLRPVPGPFLNTREQRVRCAYGPYAEIDQGRGPFSVIPVHDQRRTLIYPLRLTSPESEREVVR